MGERKINDTRPIEDNSWPAVAQAWIVDDRCNVTFAVMSSQTHGVTRPEPGVLQFMMHRRLAIDTPGIKLDDITPHQESMWLTLSDDTTRYKIVPRLQNPPLAFHNLKANSTVDIAPVATPLPHDLQL